MDNSFPKRTRVYKTGDRVICTNEAKDAMYMARGTVRFLKDIKNAKNNIVGVEFDKLVRSKEDTSIYFKCKPGFGAFLDLADICKIAEEKFDEAAFKAFIKQNPGFNDVKAQSKREHVIEMAESQGEFGEESKISVSNVNGNGVEKSQIEEVTIQEKQAKPAPAPANSKEAPKDLKKKPDAKSDLKAPIKPAPGGPKPINNPAPKVEEKKPVARSVTPEVRPQTVKVEPPSPTLTKPQIAEPVKAPAPEVKQPEPILAQQIPVSGISDANFVETQRHNLQVTNLQAEKHNLQKKLEKAQNEVLILTHKYEGLKKITDHSSTDQIKLNEQVAELESIVEKLTIENSNLKIELEKFSDYEAFKKKFEKLSVDSISIKAEVDIFKQKADKLEQENREIREQLEILELEAELEARGEEEPKSPEEYKHRYRLIKNAFQKLDLDLQIQREEYEIKMEELNSEIIKLRSGSNDFMSSDSVKKTIESKDKQIKELHDLVNDFAKTRETTENLFNEFRVKQEEVEKAKAKMNQSMDLVKAFQEQIEEFEAITRELEENLSIAELRLAERDSAIKQMSEEKAELEGKIAKFRQKLMEAEEHKNLLEMKQHTNVEVSGIDATALSTYYQDYNKVLTQKQALLKEKMLLKIKSRNDFMESMKWTIYMDCIPQNIQAQLKTKLFNTFKSVKLANCKIDIIVENLILHYIYNDTLMVESPNLVSMCRDLLKTLLHYQQYLNHLRISLLRCETVEQFAEAEKSPLFIKLATAFPKIDDIFDYIKDGELSTQFAFSEIAEGALQLKQIVPDSELHSHPENYHKFGIIAMLMAMVDKFFDPAADSETKALAVEASQKLVLVNEQIFDISIDEKKSSKIRQYSNCAAESVKELKLWLDSFLKETDRLAKTEEQMKEELVHSVWKIPIAEVRNELEQHESIKQNLAAAESKIGQFEVDISKKNKEIEVFSKTKINLEGKILKLQGIANNISTMEYEISELKKIESRQAEEIEELSTKNKEYESQLKEKNQQLDRKQSITTHFKGATQNVMSKLRMSKLLTGGANAQQSNANNPANFDYSGKTRFEINSLTSVLTNTLYQLNVLRNKELKSKLNYLTQKAPAFASYFDNFSKMNYEGQIISKTIQALGKSQSHMKSEISKLRVVDLTNQKNARETIDTFYTAKTKIKDIVFKTNELLLEGLAATHEGELPYEVSLTKEMKADPKEKLKAIYGKLSFIGVGASKKPDLHANTLSIDVALA